MYIHVSIRFLELGIYDYTFIAGSDEAIEDTWVTRYNRPLLYTAGFRSSEPTGTESENCLAIYFDFVDGFFDLPCDMRLSAVCETRALILKHAPM